MGGEFYTSHLLKWLKIKYWIFLSLLCCLFITYLPPPALPQPSFPPKSLCLWIRSNITLSSLCNNPNQYFPLLLKSFLHSVNVCSSTESHLFSLTTSSFKRKREVYTCISSLTEGRTLRAKLEAVYFNTTVNYISITCVSILNLWEVV